MSNKPRSLIRIPYSPSVAFPTVELHGTISDARDYLSATSFLRTELLERLHAPHRTTFAAILSDENYRQI